MHNLLTWYDTLCGIWLANISIFTKNKNAPKTIKQQIQTNSIIISFIERNFNFKFLNFQPKFIDSNATSFLSVASKLYCRCAHATTNVIDKITWSMHLPCASKKKLVFILIKSFILCPSLACSFASQSYSPLWISVQFTVLTLFCGVLPFFLLRFWWLRTNHISNDRDVTVLDKYLISLRMYIIQKWW